ncbi:cytochrome P450, family 78, subfamily A, polypeptide 5 [Actinidia rufa]|uniref:Cytochrome P450, family 78, subfamily A, polypeptide 5 n=1 Tax=Actinidia rufa TaxID=165716 RepID=A0A7J0DQK6_9ERIC|nr:cytochrome P450, family 78, subfamily A, polypeptide 5 [Actinidia rufa]
MSSEPFALLTPLTPVLSFNLVLCVVAFAAVFGLWLAPGGLALAFSKARPGPAIPGPSGLPILGLVFAFTGELTHRVLAELAQTFTAVQLMAFSVGFTRFIISSQPESAKEILSSSAFADRPVKESAYELLFHRAMGFAPYGDYWRNLRRISATHLFSPKRISGFGEFRRRIGLEMVGQIKDSMERNGVVSLKGVLHLGSLNNVMMSVFGRSYDFSEGDGIELEDLVSEGYELLGIFNWSDHFPVLGMLDLRGVRRRCRGLVKRVNAFVGKIIEEHRVRRAENRVVVGDESSDDFVDVLLGLENENKLCDSDMIAVLWVFPRTLFRLTSSTFIFSFPESI